MTSICAHHLYPPLFLPLIFFQLCFEAVLLVSSGMGCVAVSISLMLQRLAYYPIGSFLASSFSQIPCIAGASSMTPVPPTSSSEARLSLLHSVEEKKEEEGDPSSTVCSTIQSNCSLDMPSSSICSSPQERSVRTFLDYGSRSPPILFGLVHRRPMK